MSPTRHPHWGINTYDYDESLLSYCKQHVTVVICTLNEEKTIQDIIVESKPYCNDIVVVDGHSIDSTKQIATANGAKVVEDNGKGKGDAIRVGINLVDNDIIVFIDADMSHNPNDIPELVLPIAYKNADCVIASRPRGGSDELHGDLNKFMRMVGSDIITLGINYRFNVRITDSQNGFRAIKTHVAKKIKLCEDITTIEQEMTIKVLRKGFNLVEVPAHEFARKHGDSRISLIQVSFRYVYSWLKYLFF